jgi:hypothetical protein
MSKYIQSFYQYPVTFSSIGKTVPARSAQGEMKNIAEVSDKELEKLQNCEPMFRELVNNKKYRVLNHIPSSYVQPATQINNANAEAAELRAENEALKARLAALESGNDKENNATEGTEETTVDYSKMEYKELQKAAKEKGIDPNQKKTALIAALKDSE